MPRFFGGYRELTLIDVDLILLYYFLAKHSGVLLDFSLTVKAATLIFISGRGSAISSAK